MTVRALLAELRRRDIWLSADGERLRCAGPPGALTPELREEIRQLKSEVLQLVRSAETLARQPRAIVPLEPRGTRTPMFAVPGHNGDVFCYRTLSLELGHDQPFFGLEPPGVDGRSPPLTRVEDLAAYFGDQIAAFRPHGPLILVGFCAGGAVAFEVGQRLLKAGRAISFIALIGSPHPEWYRYSSQFRHRVREQCERLGRHVRALWSLPAADRLRNVAGWLDQARARHDQASSAALAPVLEARSRVERATVAAVRRYTPRRFDGRIVLLVPNAEWFPSAVRPWHSAAERTTEYFGPPGCLGHTMLRDYAPEFARMLEQCRDEEALQPSRQCPGS